jgi:hypothetical protein
MKQILVLILCLFAQYLYYGQLLVLMLWLFAQYLYCGAGTGSYTRFLVQCLYYEAIPVYFLTCLTCLECRVKMFFEATLAGFRGC